MVSNSSPTVRAWVSNDRYRSASDLVRNDLLWRLPATPHRTIHGRFVRTDVCRFWIPKIWTSWNRRAKESSLPSPSSSGRAVGESTT